MISNWKSLIAAAAVLLMVGAGCAQSGNVASDASLNAGAGLRDDEMTPPKEDAKASAGDDVDAAVDAYVSGAAEEKAAADSSESDASLLNSTDAEVNAYGNAYDKNEF